MTLDELKKGERARVKKVTGEGPARRRLLELGLVPKTAVVVSGEAPFGDPISLRVRASALTLRRADAQRVEVERL